MSELLEGDVAIVTGAARGNGQAIAEGLAQHGAAVAVTDVNIEGVQAVAAGIEAAGGRAAAWACDVNDRAACDAVAAAAREVLGPVSIVVNNAGILHRDDMDANDFESHWRETLDVNVTGTMNMTMACLTDLRQTKGRVINLGSVRSFVADWAAAAYAASKGAVLQMTKAYAAALAKDGIRVNAIAPGLIETEMTKAIRTNPELLERFMQNVPMGRVGAPTDLVGPVVFLASPLSEYVTGVMLPVDGGFLAV